MTMPVFRSILAALLLLGFSAASPAQTPEERAVEAIRRELTAPAVGSAGYPLPVASGWSTTRSALSFAPDYQLEQLRRGQYLLPWFAVWDLPKAGAARGYPSPSDALYFEPGVKYLAEHRLPLCIVSIEWEV